MADGTKPLTLADWAEIDPAVREAYQHGRTQSALYEARRVLKRIASGKLTKAQAITEARLAVKLTEDRV